MYAFNADDGIIKMSHMNLFMINAKWLWTQNLWINETKNTTKTYTHIHIHIHQQIYAPTHTQAFFFWINVAETVCCR